MCGIAGAIGVDNSAHVVRIMLHALQNRGQEAAGIISINDKTAHKFHGLGTVANDIPTAALDALLGKIAVGHNRYATAKNSDGAENIQPLLMKVDGAPMVMAHNGNFTNIAQLEETALKGTPFLSSSDTERFFRLMLREFRSTELKESIDATLQKMEGSCAALLAEPTQLIAIRDSWGNRPLHWGRFQDGFVIASETCALDALGVFEHFEVKAGTMVVFTLEGAVSIEQLTEGPKRLCTFEWVYFSSPVSTVFGVDVTNIRRDFGRALALEHPVKADVIAGVPDSSVIAATGYAEASESGVLDQNIILRRHNTGRTFITPGQQKRARGVFDKFAFHTGHIKDQRIVLIDDSVVRGTTSKGITASLRERGAKEVHWRIASPPVIGPCHYGIATREGEMLAKNTTETEMAAHIGADSVRFLSMQSFQSVIRQHGVSPDDGCFACMDGKYWHKT